MALFSTRAKPATQSASNAQSSIVLSNEEFKRRAKNRLIGSFVLVVLAVIGFTWLLDSQPRPAVNDVPVVIPSRENTPAWPEPVVSASAVASVAEVASNASAAVSTASLPNNAATNPTRASSVPHLNSMANLPASSAAANQLASQNTKPSASMVGVATPKPNFASTASKPASSSKFAEAAAFALNAKEKEKEKQKQQEQESARKKEELFANAAKLPNKDKTNTEAAANGQFVIQVGAYADAGKAKEIKSKLEAVGLNVFTQNLTNSGVSLIRVRVGPYSSKAAAEQHVGKIKALNLSAIVTSK